MRSHVAKMLRTIQNLVASIRINAIFHCSNQLLLLGAILTAGADQ